MQSERIKKVFVQADAPYRMSPEDLNKLYVRNNAGKMVPYASFATGRWSYNSPRLERFNGFPSLNIWAEAAAGRSSGEAMKAMEELVGNCPKASAMTGPASPIRNAWRRPKARCSMPSPSS